MTDPVNTDALRDLGVTLGGDHSWNDDAEAADLLRAAADEVDRLRAELMAVNVNAGLRLEALRAVIENAPHDHGCASGTTVLTVLPPRPAPCTCWKADVL